MAKTMEEVLERFRTIEFHDDFDMIVAIANGGIVDQRNNLRDFIFKHII